MTANKLTMNGFISNGETVLGYGDNRVCLLNRLGMVEWRGLAGSFISHSTPKDCLKFWDNPHPNTTQEGATQMRGMAAKLRDALAN